MVENLHGQSLFFLFQESPVGLNFANEEEANLFKAAVTKKLEMREQRKAGTLHDSGSYVQLNVALFPNLPYYEGLTPKFTILRLDIILK